MILQAFQVADKIVVMENGYIKCCGTPEEVFENDVIEEVFEIGFGRLEIDDKWKYYVSER